MSMSLHQVYEQVQDQMITQLTASNVAVCHNTDKGSSSEADWVNWCKIYLPKRYQIDKAFVVDSKDNFSEQIDAVIYDSQYSHLVFEHNNVKYVPAESVYCVFEVKQELNKKHLNYAGKKAKSVRKLHRTSVPITHAGGTFPPKRTHFIPAGILTLNSEWKPPLGDTFKDHISSLDNNSSLQLGCVLNAGAFTLSDNKELNICPSEISLLSFYFSLLTCLQKIGTVPAIDISAYANILINQRK